MVMSKIVLLPLEPLEMRYTKQWRNWFIDYLTENGYEYLVVDGETLTGDVIEHGFVLDAFGTNYWKMTQWANFIKLWRRGDIKDGDVVIDFDLWHPGLEIVPYIEAIIKKRLRYYGFLHAGTYDITDFTYLSGMGKWGRDLEVSWFKRVDGIFVGSEYHKEIVLRSFGDLVEGKIHVTGGPFKISDVRKSVEGLSNERDNVIVFTSRLDKEKRPWMADEIAERSGFRIVKTHELKLNKTNYYKLLAGCKISLSTALHENWGIGIIESMALGTVPIVPDGLSYRDYVPWRFRYRSVDEAVELVGSFMGYEWKSGEDRFGLIKYISKYEDSVERMVKIATQDI
jgi:glycosyltransferase involved in cell wall biosynthesis